MDILRDTLSEGIYLYMDERTEAKGSPNRLPTAGILVLLLYVLLFHELFTNLWGNGARQRKQTASSASSGPGYRPRPVQTTSKKYGMTLDGLWRRMRQATQSLELIGVKQALITKHMEEARQQARLADLKRDRDTDGSKDES